MTQRTARAAADLTGKLRQMLAVLERERQGLAALDADELFDVTRAKEQACEELADVTSAELDESSRDLALAARELNEANRRVRNLLAANVSTRLEALGGPRHAYTSAPTARATLAR